MAEGYKKYSKTVKDPKTGQKKIVRYGRKAILLRLEPAKGIPTAHVFMGK